MQLTVDNDKGRLTQLCEELAEEESLKTSQGKSFTGRFLISSTIIALSKSDEYVFRGYCRSDRQ